MNPWYEKHQRSAQRCNDDQAKQIEWLREELVEERRCCDATNAERERLRTQVETLQRRVAGLEAAKEACIGICNDTRTERDALRSQVEALREYARHQEGCSAQWGDYRCRCGFAELEGRKG